MKNYDVFFAEANSSLKTVKCKVCKSNCKVMKNVMGATGFAEAMSGHKHLHDYFYCPNKEKNWHKEAFELFQEIEKTHSISLKKIMKKDLEKMIKDNSKVK